MSLAQTDREIMNFVSFGYRLFTRFRDGQLGERLGGFGTTVSWPRRFLLSGEVLRVSCKSSRGVITLIPLGQRGALAPRGKPLSGQQTFYQATFLPLANHPIVAQRFLQ